MATSNLIYLDNAATTRPDDAVVEAMLPYLKDSYANPSAAYSMAARVRKAVEHSREQIAKLINAEPDEIYFTSGGTESDNIALKGLIADGYTSNSFPGIVSTAIEHPAVLKTLTELKNRHVNVNLLMPDSTGIVSCTDVSDAISGNTGLVSVMAANNEIGSVNDIGRIGSICRERGVVFHTDAVQAVGHIPIDVKAMNIDALSASGHKFHGPKGVGFLYCRRGINIASLFQGGGQERGLRSGTENVASIVGMGTAAELAGNTMAEDSARISRLRDDFINRVLNDIPGSILNGPLEGALRLPGNMHFAFTGIEGASLLIRLDMKNICASTGSACSASKSGPSHVLKSVGLADEYINGSIRLTMSKYTTRDELDRTFEVLKESITALRTLCAY